MGRGFYVMDTPDDRETQTIEKATCRTFRKAKITSRSSRPMWTTPNTVYAFRVIDGAGWVGYSLDKAKETPDVCEKLAGWAASVGLLKSPSIDVPSVSDDVTHRYTRDALRSRSLVYCFFCSSFPRQYVRMGLPVNSPSFLSSLWMWFSKALSTISGSFTKNTNVGGSISDCRQ